MKETLLRWAIIYITSVLKGSGGNSQGNLGEQQGQGIFFWGAKNTTLIWARGLRGVYERFPRPFGNSSTSKVSNTNDKPN